MHTKGLRYDLNLGESVEGILENDFWMMDRFTPSLFALNKEPIKFSASASIFVRRGKFKMDLNLIPTEMEAPCIVNVSKDCILNPKELSDDFEASFIVLSPRMKDNIFLFINDPFFYNLAKDHPVMPLSPEMVDRYDNLYSQLSFDFNDTSNPNRYHAVLHTLLAFVFRYVMKGYRKLGEDYPANMGRMSERFLRLVQQYFKTNRFLEFYADKLQVTPKHLSRTVKQQTGYTAVEWIERYIILEAEVLLKSSDLHIQQIADELNFPSQSVFGKYFKKKVGQSPRDFRNRK
ncbi:MAG: helix-turn-helix domain-containing protein [Muribaculaceae bacterium]|nr:helix-turn-helix domain-containing protein [Muribaculaceae bacterium]